MVTLLDIFNQFGLESKLSDGLNQLELGEHLVIKKYEYRKGKPQKLGTNIKSADESFEKYVFIGKCYKNNQTYKVTLKINTSNNITEVWMYRELTSPIKLRKYHPALWWGNDGKFIFGKYYRKI